MNYTDSVPLGLRERQREDFDFWASSRDKTKTFLIGKELKTNDLLKTAAERGETERQNPTQNPG